MSTDLALRDDGLAPDVISSAFSLAEKVARTEFVPGALRGKPEAVMACILMGREIGVGPMQSLSKIHVVDGRPAMAAELMRARALEAGHELWYEEKSSTRVTVCGRRRGSEQVSKVTWTMDDAKRAGIAGKNNWRKYPRAMLTARATAELCRDLFPDTLGGISYVVEELEDGVPDTMPPDGEPVAAEPVKSAKRGTVRRTSPQTTDGKPRATSGPPLPHELDGADDGDVVDAEVVDEGDDQGPAEDLTKLTKAQLILRCRDAGLDVEGTKDELIARLSGDVDDGVDADFGEPSRGAEQGPDDGDVEDDRRPYDRDGAQKAFHARLHELGLDYTSEVKPWMLAQPKVGMSLSKLPDEKLHALLSAMEDRPDALVTSVREHAEAAAAHDASVAGDGEAPAAEDTTAEGGDLGDSGPVDATPAPAASPSLAERAHARAVAASTHGQLRSRIEQAWREIAPKDRAAYEASWRRVRELLGGPPPEVEDWSVAPELDLRREAEDLTRLASQLVARRAGG